MKLLDWGAALIGFFIVTILLKKIASRQSITLIVSILFFSGLGAAILSLLQVWFGFKAVPQAVVPGSFFSNKNMAAQYMLLTAPLGWYLMLKLDKYLSHLVAAGVGVIYAVIVYSTARAAWLSLVAQLFLASVWVIYEWVNHSKKWLRSKRWIVVVTSLSVCLGMLFINQDGYNLNALTEYNKELVSIGNSVSSESNVRLAIWANSMEMIKDNWFKGIGLGNWVVEYPVYHQRVIIDKQMSVAVKHDNAHNDYIEIIAELGIVGFLLFLAILVYTLIYWYKVISFKNDSTTKLRITPEIRLFSAVMFLSLIGIGVDALFSFPLQQPVPVFWCFMLVAFIVSTYHSHLESRQWQLSAQANKIIASCAFIGAMGLTIMHAYWYQSEIYKRQAIIASRTGNLDAIKINAEKAYALKPFHSELLHAIGVGLREQGQVEQAVGYMERALRHYPHTLTYLTNMVDTYIRVKDFHKARRTLKHLITIKPNDFMTQRLYGLILINEFNEYEIGVSHLRRAIEVNPKHQQAEDLRARIVKFEKLKHRQQ